MSAAPRRPARDYHTRLGWWVISHESGGSLLIGAVAALVLLADLIYVVSHWRGSFATGCLAALVSMVVVLAVALALRRMSFGADPRVAARRRQRTTNGAAFVFILGFLVGTNLLHGSWAGSTLGLLAVLSGYFAALSGYWLVAR